MLTTIRIILYPFIPVYLLIVTVRNFLFDKGIFPSRKVNADVISVGNIPVGGSGKTPAVIYITKLLKSSGKKPAVLSRGYLRKSKGYLLVSDGKEIKASVEQCGDEIYQTAIECEVPTAVSESRVKGANKLLKEVEIDTIVLDDAFQHRWIERDVNLLIFEQRFLRGIRTLKQQLLPTGNMREPFSAVNRADAIIINRKFSDKSVLPGKIKKYLDGKKIFTAYYQSNGFYDIKSHNFYSIKEFHGQNSLVVGGIANPFSFLNALRQANINTAHKLIFRDHKNYTEKEIRLIRKEFYASNAYSVITTHKDAVKLKLYAKELDDIDIYYLQIEMRMDEEEEFKQFIFNKLKKT